jgi:tetratricopeptide (TPR) repeat protein
LIRQARYADAIRCFEEGIAIDRTVGNLTGIATKLSNLAILQATTGDHALALDNFQRALEIDRQTGNLNGQMMKLSNIADLWGLTGQYQRAYDCILQAIEISRAIDAKSYLAHTIASKASICIALHRLDEARTAADAALALAEETNSHSIMVKVLTYLGDIEKEQGHLEQALEFSGRAVAILDHESIFDVTPESTYYGHCLILRAMGRNDEAATLLERVHRLMSEKLAALPDTAARDKFIASDPLYIGIKRDWEERTGAT